MIRLRSDPRITDADIEGGKQALVRDGAWASIPGVLAGGVIMVGLALSLDAGPTVMACWRLSRFSGNWRSFQPSVLWSGCASGAGSRCWVTRQRD
jgi:hypothetical protein